jgi:hypothetical protein
VAGGRMIVLINVAIVLAAIAAVVWIAWWLS